MADIETANPIINGTTLVVGVDVFQTGTIVSGPNAGAPIYAAINGIRVNNGPASDANPVPVKDVAAETALGTIATNTNSAAASLTAIAASTTGAATAAAQTTGNTSLGTIATAQGAQGTGLNPPTGGTGILGFLSGIYNSLITALFTKPAPFTIVALDIATVTTAGTPVTVLNLGHFNAGGFIHTINPAGMFVAQIGNAGTVDGGNTMYVLPSQPYDVIPNLGSVTVNSTVNGLAISGYGLN